MTASLSVNLNKVALLRNSRGGTNPSPKADPGQSVPKVAPPAGGTQPKGAAPKQPAQPKKGNAS